MPIQTTILTKNLELPVRFACLWTGRRIQNPHRPTQGKHPESTHADLGMELTACLLVGFLCWMTTLFLACNGAPAMVQMSNFIKTLNVFRGSPRNQLHFYGESLVLLYVWFGLLLSKKHLQGEKNIFLLFSVHNQALYSLHQIDVTFLWKWEMSGVAQKLETLTLSPDTFGRGPGALLTLSVWILSPRRRAFALKWLEKQRNIHHGVIQHTKTLLFKAGLTSELALCCYRC